MPKCRRYIACYNIILYCIYGISAIAAVCSGSNSVLYSRSCLASFTCVRTFVYIYIYISVLTSKHTTWAHHYAETKKRGAECGKGKKRPIRITQEKKHIFNIDVLLLGFELKHTKENGLRGIWTTVRLCHSCTVRSVHESQRRPTELIRIVCSAVVHTHTTMCLWWMFECCFLVYFTQTHTHTFTRYMRCVLDVRGLWTHVVFYILCAKRTFPSYIFNGKKSEKQQNSTEQNAKSEEKKKRRKNP